MAQEYGGSRLLVNPGRAGGLRASAAQELRRVEAGKRAPTTGAARREAETALSVLPVDGYTFGRKLADHKAIVAVCEADHIFVEMLAASA